MNFSEKDHFETYWGIGNEFLNDLKNFIYFEKKTYDVIYCANSKTTGYSCLGIFSAFFRKREHAKAIPAPVKEVC